MELRSLRSVLESIEKRGAESFCNTSIDQRFAYDLAHFFLYRCYEQRYDCLTYLDGPVEHLKMPADLHRKYKYLDLWRREMKLAFIEARREVAFDDLSNLPGRIYGIHSYLKYTELDENGLDPDLYDAFRRVTRSLLQTENEHPWPRDGGLGDDVLTPLFLELAHSLSVVMRTGLLHDAAFDTPPPENGEDDPNGNADEEADEANQGEELIHGLSEHAWQLRRNFLRRIEEQETRSHGRATEMDKRAQDKFTFLMLVK